MRKILLLVAIAIGVASGPAFAQTSPSYMFIWNGSSWVPYTGSGGGGGGTTGATATRTSVAQTGASVQLLASNTARVEAIITNTTGVTCNIGLGGAASSTTGPLLQAGAVYVEDHFTGVINSNCASGSVAVTEVTP